MIEIGTGATLQYGSDSYPATVIEVKSERLVVIQEDTATRLDNGGPYTESQQYAYTPNPDGRTLKVSLRKSGYWRTVGGDTLVFIGNRRMYRDPSF